MAISLEDNIFSLGKSPFILSQKGVSTAPGWIEITLILCSLSSSLIDDEKPLKPYFEATYADE